MDDCQIACDHGYQIDNAGCTLCECHECTAVTGCDLDCEYGLGRDDRHCEACQCRGRSYLDFVSHVVPFKLAPATVFT